MNNRTILLLIGFVALLFLTGIFAITGNEYFVVDGVRVYYQTSPSLSSGTASVNQEHHTQELDDGVVVTGQKTGSGVASGQLYITACLDVDLEDYDQVKIVQSGVVTGGGNRHNGYLSMTYPYVQQVLEARDVIKTDEFSVITTIKRDEALGLYTASDSAGRTKVLNATDTPCYDFRASYACVNTCGASAELTVSQVALTPRSDGGGGSGGSGSDTTNTVFLVGAGLVLLGGSLYAYNRRRG